MKKLLLLFFSFFIISVAWAQQNEDAEDAYPVCGNEIISFPTVQGDGSVDDVFTVQCGGADQDQTKWLRFKVLTGGTLAFEILPQQSSDDYDFYVFGPNPDVNNLGTSIRGNYSAVTGLTGLQIDAPNACEGGGGDPFSRHMTVLPGEEYLIFVNNFSASGQPFNLRWDGKATLDCSIVVGNLGPDQQVCEGEEVVLDGTPNPPDPTVTYSWAVDTNPTDGTDVFNPIPGETGPTLTINNDVTGIYQVTYDNGTVTDSDEVLVEFIAPPNIAMDDLEECGLGGEAQFDFDQIIADFETANAGVSLELYEVDPQANPGAPPITGTYSNTTSPQTIYALQTVEPGCSTVVPFEISVIESPNIPLPNVEECGTGGVAQFNFDQIISDFETANPAITLELYDVDPIANPGATPITGTYTNTDNPQTIYGLQTDTNTGCENVVEFQLIVTEGEQAAIADQQACSDTETADFNFDQLISDFETANPNITVSLHLSEADAQASPGVNPQTGTFTNTSNPQTIYSRQEDETTGCVSVVEFDLIVNQNPQIAMNDVEECGVSGVAQFDFDQIIADFESANADLDLELYEVDPEANPGATPITGTYTNASNPQIIYAQQTNSTTGCSGVVSLNLIVNNSPQIAMTNLTACGVNDEAQFDFDQVITDFETANPDVSLELFAVDPEANPGSTPITGMYTNTANPQTIFAQQTDVNTDCSSVQTFELIVNNAPNIAMDNLQSCGINDEAQFDFDAIIADFAAANPDVDINLYEVDPQTNPGSTPVSGSYTNTSNPQTIYAGQTNVNNNCVSVMTFELIVNNEPEIAMNDVEQCGDGSGAVFDLDAIISDFETNNTGVTVVLYEVDPQTNPGATPITGSYETTTASVTIFALQTVTATGCESVMSFNLNANSSSALPQATLESCPDPEGDDATIATFTLSDADAQIDAGNNGYSITYYETQADLDAGNALPNDYVSDSKTILALATGGDLDCPSQTEVTLTVLASPVANDVTDQQCSPSDVATFNLLNLEADITGGATGVTVSFFETVADAMNGSPTIADNYETATTTVIARVDNGTCFTLSDVTLTVTDAVALPATSIGECDSGDGTAAFDLNAFMADTESQIDADVQFYDSFTGAQNQDAAEELNGTLQTGNRVVYLLVDENAVECTTVRDIDLIVNENPPVLNNFMIQNCELSDTNNEFYLDESTLDAAYSYELYETAAEANTGDEAAAIVEPYISNGDEFIFLRTENPTTGCYSVSEVFLEIIPLQERTLEPIEVCFGEEFLLPDGRKIRDSGNFVVENPLNCSLDYYTLNFVVCDTDYCKPQVPSGFSPNADGVNNSIYLIEPWGCTISVTSVKIFNRWGEVIFEAAGNDFNWQGQYQNGQLAQEGVYIYHIEFDYQTNTGEQGSNNTSGTINLIR